VVELAKHVEAVSGGSSKVDARAVGLVVEVLSGAAISLGRVGQAVAVGNGTGERVEVCVV
jgi:hypothetical protein